MTARKQRPARGTPVTAGMSTRDIAAAIGLSTGELYRWMGLAKLPEGVFEDRLQASFAAGKRPTAASLTAEPVPAPGRVDRAMAIYRRMTPDERQAFRAMVATPADLE